MRAMAIDQAVAALLVAEQHQIFAEQFDRPHRARALQLVHQRRRLPVHPHQLAAGVFRPGAGDQVVRFLAHHGGGSFVGFVRLLNEWANYAMSGIGGKRKFSPAPGQQADAEAEARRRRGARHRFRREPRPRTAPVAGVRPIDEPDDAERRRARRRPAARHRATHPVHAGARRLCRQRRQAVHADAACADACGCVFALEPGGRRAAAGARPHRDCGAGNLFARAARRRRSRLHRARQPGAGVFHRPRNRLSPAGVLHLRRPRDARPVRR